MIIRWALTLLKVSSYLNILSETSFKNNGHFGTKTDLWELGRSD